MNMKATAVALHQYKDIHTHTHTYTHTYTCIHSRAGVGAIRYTVTSALCCVFNDILNTSRTAAVYSNILKEKLSHCFAKNFVIFLL
jgi:hypothetical protein